jgi:hypothetical protein
LLEARQAVDRAFGQVRQFYSSELRQEGLSLAARSSGQIYGAMPIKASFHRAGWFAEDVEAGAFIEWYARAMPVGLRFERLLEIALERRIHGRNTVTKARDLRGGYARVLKAGVDRRRTASRAPGESVA